MNLRKQSSEFFSPSITNNEENKTAITPEKKIESVNKITSVKKISFFSPITTDKPNSGTQTPTF